MLDVLRSCIIIPLIYLYTLVMASLSLVLSFFDQDGKLQHWCASTWCRMIAVTAGARITVRGLENLPKDQAAVFIANHTSYLDIPAIWGYVPVQFRIMAKRSLFYVPFMGWFLWRAGHIPVDHESSRAALANISRATEKLKAGCSLVVFAEGHRSADGVLREFKPGGFKLAQKAGVPIVPVTIINAHRVLKKDSLVFHAGQVEVIIDPPLSTAGYTSRTLPGLMNQTHSIIAGHLSEHPSTPQEKLELQKA
ncbi:MAG: 1-acyl-sn-glycerol-3-phosphate acyltransferase [Acidobacteria bacterium]|nr:1-acyl-sn-glycerol-3-phosphate acyltransferase [Acidobacteriota bacterium]